MQWWRRSIGTCSRARIEVHQDHHQKRTVYLDVHWAKIKLEVMLHLRIVFTELGLRNQPENQANPGPPRMSVCCVRNNLFVGLGIP
jgi:hypothetical protein